VIGEIEGVVEGQLFKDRQALHEAGVHRGIQQGIGGGGESIVLSGGYVDDKDEGDVILYTGQGGRDQATGRQIKDQELTRGNLALENHYREGNPIRVCRGANLQVATGTTACTALTIAGPNGGPMGISSGDSGS
jgi:putative restriction endonuclease